MPIQDDDLLVYEPTGLLYRKDPVKDDLNIIRESKAVYQDLSVGPDDMVLDLGGHIGSAAKMFLDAGARTFSVEPMVENYEVLCRNLAPYEGRAGAVNAAVAPAGVEKLSFYPHLKGHPAMGRTQHVRGRKPVEVKAVSLEDLLEEHQPTIIKCDIEHGEYELPAMKNLPKRVRGLFMELHGKIQIGTPNELLPYNKMMLDFEQSLLDQGFEPVMRHVKVALNHPFAICATYQRIA